LAALYLISYLLYSIGYYSLQIHKKIWNSILATVFVATALAGIFLALQISYKWNIPFIKTVLKYHVEFGIGMAFTGLFHLLWHRSYYFTGINREEKVSEQKNQIKVTHQQIRANLFIIGLVSTSFQLLLIREMMNISGGYEMVAGTFLCSWLIVSAIGAAAAGRSDNVDIKKLNLVFSLSPLISIIFLLLFSRVLLNTGETPSMLMSIVFTLIVLFPVCFISGFTFIKLSSIAQNDTEFIPGKSFSIETTGGILAGILISLLTSGILNTYQVIILLEIGTFTYFLISWVITKPGNKVLAAFISVTISIGICITNPDIFFRQILLPQLEITETRDTPYGNITSALNNGEASRYYNHRLLDFGNDEIESEENIHYAMLQSDNPESVVVISGSPKSYLPEIMKYNVREIISIERDPYLLKQYQNTKNPLSEKFKIISDDAFRYIAGNSQKSDVILLLAPPPSTLLINRFYTTEFFSEVKQGLNEGGVFMCSPGMYDNYMNSESLKLFSSVFNSLSRVFKNVIPIAGNKLYFIASDKEISTRICHMAETKKIANSYVSSDFLSDDLIEVKSKEIMSLIDLNIRENRLDSPLACFYFQSYNLTKNLSEKSPVIITLLLLFAMPVLLIKKRNLAMYFTASALAGSEIIILMILQLTLGNMYQLTGLIMAGMMAGLAAGSAINFKFHSIKIQGIILVFIYIIYGFCANSLMALKSPLLVIVLLLVSAFIPALLTGNIFRELTAADKNIKLSSETYSSDLAGSAFGLISVSVLIIPVFGIKDSLYILSVLVFAGFLFGTVRYKL